MASMLPTSAIQRRIQRNCEKGVSCLPLLWYRYALGGVAYLEASKSDTDDGHDCGDWSVMFWMSLLGTLGIESESSVVIWRTGESGVMGAETALAASCAPSPPYHGLGQSRCVDVITGWAALAQKLYEPRSYDNTTEVFELPRRASAFVPCGFAAIESWPG